MSHRRTASNSGPIAASGGASTSASGGGHNIFHHTAHSSNSIHGSSGGSTSSSDKSDYKDGGLTDHQKRDQHRLAVLLNQEQDQEQEHPSQQPLAQANTATTTSTTTTTNSGSNNNNNTGHQHVHRSSKSHRHKRQTLLTKALLSYLNFFRIVQPLVSLAAFGTITPVLSYFRTQTIFPTIQATLYLFTATLACCSLFFSIMYLIDVLYHKPLFWPFTNKYFRPTSKARIGGDLIICMVFSGLWFLSGVGLVIDTVWVDCGRLIGLESVFKDNHRSVDKIRRVCQLEKATLGLAVVSWACWMGVLLVLLYGHFWKRRQVIAERLRDRLARRRQPQPPAATKAQAEGTSSAVAAHPTPDAVGIAGGAITPSGASVISGRGVGGGASGSNNNNNNSSDRLHLPSSSQQEQRRQDPSGDSEFDCQDMEGEVGMTGIICRYDDEEGHSTLGQGSRRSRPQQPSA